MNILREMSKVSILGLEMTKFPLCLLTPNNMRKIRKSNKSFVRKLSYRRTDRAEFIKDSSKVGSLKGTPIALRTSIKAAFHWIIHVVFEQTMCDFEP